MHVVYVFWNFFVCQSCRIDILFVNLRFICSLKNADVSVALFNCFIMKKLFFLLGLFALSLSLSAQTYTNVYPPKLVKMADKWMRSGVWRNGFDKASPAKQVNSVEFYLQWLRNRSQWDALFKWLQNNDLTAVPSGKIPIEGTSLVVSVEDSENWCSADDLKAGKGSESHRRKIDFMYVVSGTEGFCRLDHDTSTPNNTYTLEKDRIEYTFDPARLERIESVPGTFNIMFPCDYHIAKVKTNKPSQKLRVLVIKVDYAL